jgi:hypothetical protein
VVINGYVGKINRRQVQICLPIVPAIWEAEEGGSLEPMNRKPPGQLRETRHLKIKKTISKQK